MGAVFCNPGCTCERHRPRTLSQRLKQTGRPPCKIGCTCELHQGPFRGKSHTPESRQLISDANVGRTRTEKSIEASRAGLLKWHSELTYEQRQARSAAISKGNPRSSTSGRFGWTGGYEGQYYASFLCPLGYVREFQVNYGPGGSAHYKLDFALVDAKIDIELDGPYHDHIQDEERDARLRTLGWKVIRIAHQ